MNPTYTVVIERDVSMFTRDGVSLAADVYRPVGEGPFPVLLLRTPYGKGFGEQNEARFFPPHGYIVVVQDIRGRWASQGDFIPGAFDAEDGYDAVEWAAQLPGSSGKVGLVGQSYLTGMQLKAAMAAPPHLCALSPVGGSLEGSRSTRRGVVELGWTLPYFANMARETMRRRGVSSEYRERVGEWFRDPKLPMSMMRDEAYRHLPLSDWGKWLGDLSPALRDTLTSPEINWTAPNDGAVFSKLDYPMFHVSGWYDPFTADMLRLFKALREDSGSETVRSSQRMLIGPWAHLEPYNRPTSQGTGDIDFGPEARIELMQMQLEWFDHFLKGAPPRFQESPVRLFVMGANKWRDEPDWPLARARTQTFYLRADAPANGEASQGKLSSEAPADETPDRYVYDPADPTPTLGGNGLGLALGVYDQRKVEARPDVLVYTGEPLQADLEVTGHVKLKLFAASSAPDTDYMAKLVDVRPDGYAQNIAEGYVRLRFRTPGAPPALAVPHETLELDVDLNVTSHVFLAGHRLRLDITSSNFPRYDRNPNTSDVLWTTDRTAVAQQTVFHDALRPSHLLLPVVPMA